jgi:hypothetical protein
MSKQKPPEGGLLFSQQLTLKPELTKNLLEKLEHEEAYANPLILRVCFY